MYKARRGARELALNILFQMDVTHLAPEEALQAAHDNVVPEEEIFAYAEMLASGVNEELRNIDAAIQELSKDWPIDRQPAVDRNILRMAIYEMGYANSAPPAVVIDEAVELAKKYSTEDSGKFVNGVLAAYLRRYEKDMEDSGVGSTDS
jgi:transcription antitermination protein NusB